MSEFNPHNPEEKAKTDYDRFVELAQPIARWRAKTVNLALQSQGMNPHALQDQATNDSRDEVSQILIDNESDYALNALEGYASHLNNLGWDLSAGDIAKFMLYNGAICLFQTYQDANGDSKIRLWRYYFDKSLQNFRLHTTDEISEGQLLDPATPRSQEEADLGINDVPLSPEQVKELLFATGIAKDAIKEYYNLAGNGITEDAQ